GGDARAVHADAVRAQHLGDFGQEARAIRRRERELRAALPGQRAELDLRGERELALRARRRAPRRRDAELARRERLLEPRHDLGRALLVRDAQPVRLEYLE